MLFYPHNTHPTGYEPERPFVLGRRETEEQFSIGTTLKIVHTFRAKIFLKEPSQNQPHLLRLKSIIGYCDGYIKVRAKGAPDIVKHDIAIWMPFKWMNIPLTTLLVYSLRFNQLEKLDRKYRECFTPRNRELSYEVLQESYLLIQHM